MFSTDRKFTAAVFATECTHSRFKKMMRSNSKLLDLLEPQDCVTGDFIKINKPSPNSLICRGAIKGSESELLIQKFQIKNFNLSVLRSSLWRVLLETKPPVLLAEYWAKPDWIDLKIISQAYGLAYGKEVGKRMISKLLLVTKPPNKIAAQILLRESQHLRRPVAKQNF